MAWKKRKIEPTGSLFDDPPAQQHSPTSVAAGEAIAPVAATLRAEVLAAIQAAGADGLTDEEVQTRLSLGGSTARPRRIELVESGLVTNSGRTRPTASGRQAVVWVATVPERTHADAACDRAARRDERRG